MRSPAFSEYPPPCSIASPQLRGLQTHKSQHCLRGLERATQEQQTPHTTLDCQTDLGLGGHLFYPMMEVGPGGGEICSAFHCELIAELSPESQPSGFKKRKNWRERKTNLSSTGDSQGPPAQPPAPGPDVNFPSCLHSSPRPLLPSCQRVHLAGDSGRTGGRASSESPG